jgi:hypothetical protein
MESTRYAPLTEMNEVPEEAGTRPGRAAPSALSGEPTLWEAGSVCVLSSAVGLGLSQRSDGRYKACPCRYCVVWLIILPAKAKARGTAGIAPPTQPPGATESGGATATDGSGRGGGANAAESAGAAGSGGLSPTRKLERQRDRRDREREAVRCGGGAVPSAGWREVATWCHASAGVSHR